jgi:hypothetical protein
MADLRLHTYWRSSAAYRVRIALGLKGLAWQAVPVDLLHGEQRGAAYLAINPQAVIPSLEVDGAVLTQSLAVLEGWRRRIRSRRCCPQIRWRVRMCGRSCWRWPARFTRCRTCASAMPCASASAPMVRA